MISSKVIENLCTASGELFRDAVVYASDTQIRVAIIYLNEKGDTERVNRLSEELAERNRVRNDAFKKRLEKQHAKKR